MSFFDYCSDGVLGRAHEIANDICVKERLRNNVSGEDRVRSAVSERPYLKVIRAWESFHHSPFVLGIARWDVLSYLVQLVRFDRN